MTQSTQKDQNVNQFNKFLQNNTQFLQEKYDQYFKKSPISIKQFNKESAVKYIYDVFSFSKYEEDQKMNMTLQRSLTKNIQDFLAILVKRKVSFNNKTAVQLLKFCIENNEMFAVKYDKKDKKLTGEENQGEGQAEQKEQQQRKHQDNIGNQEKAEQRQQQSRQKTKKTQQKEDQVQNDKEIHFKHDQNDKDLSSMVNQFDGLDEQALHNNKTTDPELIKKNLKTMYQFYCKQQQNVGVHATFDRISHECKTMTLGKFLAFANATEILNGKIDKNFLMTKFKTIAQGKKEIEFQKFYELIQTLSAIDGSMISTLGVDEKLGFKSKLKQRFFPFSTRQAPLKDIKKDHDIFVPKLTSHSGKLQDQLQIQLKKRKQLKALSGSLNKSKVSSLQNQQLYDLTNVSKRYDTNKITTTPARLVNGSLQDIQHDLTFLDKVINSEQTDEEWLKQYKIHNKKNSHIAHPRLMSRKQSIIPNLKKRVQQLQKRQNGRNSQLINIEKRQYMSHNRQRERISRSILN